MPEAVAAPAPPPAAQPAALPETKPEGPSPLRAAIEAARDTVKTLEPAAPGEGEVVLPASQGQPEGDPPAEQPQDANALQTGDEQAPEGTQEAEGETKGEGEGEGDGEFQIVALPGREPGEPDREWEITDPELAEDIRRLKKGYMRSEELKRRLEPVQEKERELGYIQDRLAHDPTGFFVEHTPKELRAALVADLLADPDIYREVVPQIAAWSRDPRARDLWLAKSEADRLKREREFDQLSSERARVQENAQAIISQVEGMIPDGADEQAALAFRNDALRDLKEHVERNNIKHFPPEQVREFLEKRGRLRLYGFTPTAPGAPAAPRRVAAAPAAPTDPQPRAPNGQFAPKDGAPAPSTVQSARETGQRLREASARRRAAATAPAGAGAAAGQPVAVPRTGNVRDAIKAARGQLRFNP